MDSNNTIDDVVAGWCLPLAVAAITLLACCLMLAVVEAGLVAVTRGTTWRWSPAPYRLRRLAFALCGLSLTLPPTVGSLAAAAEPTAAAGHSAPARQGQSCPPSCTDRLTGLRLPDLPAHRPTAAPTIRVRPGDCLWTIATGLLPRSADDASISTLTRALYRSNRDRIGTDPDLIFPGIFLTHPEVTR